MAAISREAQNAPPPLGQQASKGVKSEDPGREKKDHYYKEMKRVLIEKRKREKSGQKKKKKFPHKERRFLHYCAS